MRLLPEFERIRQETQSAAAITDRKMRESLAAERQNVSMDLRTVSDGD